MSVFSVAAFSALAMLVNQPGACERIAEPTDHWGAYQSQVSFGDVQLRSLKGMSRCDIAPEGTVECHLWGPQTFRVMVGDEQSWFSVREEMVATVKVEAGVTTCRARFEIRTHQIPGY